MNTELLTKYRNLMAILAANNVSPAELQAFAYVEEAIEFAEHAASNGDFFCIDSYAVGAVEDAAETAADDIVTLFNAITEA